MSNTESGKKVQKALEDFRKQNTDVLELKGLKCANDCIVINFITKCFVFTDQGIGYMGVVALCYALPKEKPMAQLGIYSELL